MPLIKNVSKINIDELPNCYTGERVSGHLVQDINCLNGTFNKCKGCLNVVCEGCGFRDSVIQVINKKKNPDVLVSVFERGFY